MIFRALKQEACLERESVSMVPFMAADWQDQIGDGYMFLSTEALRTSEIYLKLRQTQVGDEVKLWVPAYHFAICLTQT
ncbi:MAG: hypothetical protein ACRC6H_10335, partial [Culicoidibacterales bacterium]